jgi:hypothetical protein
MVFTDAEGIDAEFVSKNRFSDDIAQALGVGKHATGGIDGDVAEGVEAEFDHCGVGKGVTFDAQGRALHVRLQDAIASVKDVNASMVGAQRASCLPFVWRPTESL